ncbi:Peptidoglycan-N-acetylglucosamine deacetylase [Streptomyces sp. ADI96-15]|nr:Peptidoglycan-N-acetylglucosamine deacetylase [Streptomyces sp. ADI96-15]
MTSRSRAARRRRLPLRYLLPSLFLVALSAMLMLRGYVHSEILADHRVQPPAATDQVPEEVIEGGPVIANRDGKPATFSVPDHKLVLTFDDGPDPEWTPKVLDVLAEHDAHGVFFVTGTMASRHPELVRRMVDEGHELGLHTFNHPDLSFQSRSRIDWELTQNQLALAGAAGVRTSLFRPPYSSFSNAMDNKSWPVTEYIGSLGYLTVVNNTDSEDWKRPGTDEIIRRATPRGGEGAIVLMHDSGGDRSQTVEALDRFLPSLKEKGYEFTNLTEALNAPSAHTPVTGAAPLAGRRLGHRGRHLRERHRGPGGRARRHRRPRLRPLRADAGALLRPRPQGALADVPLGPAGHRTGHRAGARLQRGEMHRQHGHLADRQ